MDVALGFVIVGVEPSGCS